MSSSPRPEPRRVARPRGWSLRGWSLRGWSLRGWSLRGWSLRGWSLRGWSLRGWSLRARLLGALIALLAVACVVIGVATEVAVYQVQVRQLDKRLNAAGVRTEDAFGGRHESRKGGSDTPPLPVQGPGTLAAFIVNGQAERADVLDSAGRWQPISAAEIDVLTALPTDGRPHTRALGERGDFRMVAKRSPNGTVLVTGLPLSDVYVMQYELALIEIGVGLAALIIAGLAGALIVRRTLRPLRRVAGIAGCVAELPLDRGEVALPVRVSDVDTDPRTEVGQVGAALNRMLGHVGAALSSRQASETRVRHFVADASHELRTPLAAIRGYAELARRTGAAVPAEVAHAIGRVESEAVRMTALVEDLLLLARLDAGRPLAGEPVDLSRLAIDAVSDARVAGPDHRWRLDLPAESVSVIGDAPRLHQVLANLLANARTHTPPGTTVTTSLAVHNGHAALRVADNGPGIPADLLPEVFDRFARGDTSRSRAAGSTGLGLAIVAAVVAAHDGSVEATSEPGRTAFTVRLPAALDRRPEQPAGASALPPSI
jgi:two-component system, OmpR family, sensor kinase